MKLGYSPGLRLLLAMADGFGEVSVIALRAAWNRWIGPQRFYRELGSFRDHGWAQCPDRVNLARVVHVTDTGRLVAIGGRDPVARWGRSWDGRWRMVMFDIPEARLALRTRLRRKLHELGFGYLQKSVWITPDSASDLRQSVAGIASDVESFLIMEARPGAGETDTEIVGGAWNFDRINRYYAAYLSVLNAAGKGRFGTRGRMAWFEVEAKAWRRAVNTDPLLPDVLLPAGYRGREAWEMRHETLGRIVRHG